MKSIVYQLINNNVSYLKKLQVDNLKSFDYGAIYDPVLKRVIGDNYATEEYTLAASHLFKAKHKYQKSIEEAMDFHVKTTDRYPLGVHTEHTQHRRLGFIETFLNVKDPKPEWLNCIKRWNYSHPCSNTNWFAMNALLNILIYKVTKNYSFKILSWIDLVRTLRYQARDGFFSDTYDSRKQQFISPYYFPIAYHLYTSALLHRYWHATGNRLARNAFLRGAHIVLWLTSKNGDISYRGRSAGHVFTYAMAYYLMEAAASTKREGSYKAAARAILTQLIVLQDKLGRFPIVANNEAIDKIHPTQEHYAYHSVYNAHSSAWLARSLEIINEKIRVNALPVGIKTLSNSNLVVIRKKRYVCTVSGGNGVNNDSAISIVMLDIGKGRCFFMPGNRDKLDFFSAGHVVRLIKRNRILATTVGITGTLALKGNEVSGKTVNKYFILNRKYVFESALIKIHDEIIPNCDDCKIEIQMTLSAEHKRSLFSDTHEWIFENRVLSSQNGKTKKTYISFEGGKNKVYHSYYGIKI